MAEQEREKGNEAFRAEDYEEALEHYNTSIRIDSNIIAYNNRAMTCEKFHSLILQINSVAMNIKCICMILVIKLGRYEDALNDCNLVLSMEHGNVKALLRRAVTLEHLKKSAQVLEQEIMI